MAWHPFRNVGLKIAALGLGTLLWVTVSGQQAERSVRVGLEFRKLPPTIEITGDPPETVEVWIRGASSQISRLGLGDVVAFLDLTDAQPGMRVFPLHTDQPIGVEVTKVDPPEVMLSLETGGKMRVTVKPLIVGQPAAGYTVAAGGTVVDPPAVEVSGPESRLKLLTTATTERVSVEGATADVTATVNVAVDDPTLRVRQPHMAQVTIKIVRIH